MTTTKSSFELISVNKPNNMVEIKKSKYIKDELAMGMFATQDIKKGTDITIYFGDVLNTNEVFEKYKQDKDIMKYTRKGYDFIVDGSEAYKLKNKNLLGVYVNDITKLKSTKRSDIKHYNKSKMICNVEAIETSDFPVYRARRDIKKGQELFVHYGAAYWLLELGVPPNKLSKYTF